MKGRRSIAVLAGAVAIMLVMSGIAAGSSGSKSLKAFFKNIKIIVNGSTVSTGEEPFIVDGRVYVPLADIGRALNAAVSWDSANSSVKISGTDSATVSNLQLQLMQKENRIKVLEAQLADCSTEGATDSGDSELSELEADLEDDYDMLEDVEVDSISLDGDEDEVDVEIEVDLDDFEDEWADLRDYDIEDWLEDMTEDIQDALDEDTEIDGEIIDSDSGDTLVEFSKDGEDDLEVSFEDDDYREGVDEDAIDDLEDELEGETYYIGPSDDEIEFEVTSMSYSTSSDSITVRITAQDPDPAADAWDDLDEDDIEDDVEYICDDIADEFMDEADADPEWVYLNVRDSDGDVLGSYDYDVEDGELD